MSKNLRRSYFVYTCAFLPVVISALLYGYINNFFSPRVLVHTKYGKLQGFAATSRDGRTFYQFNSVPYAKPPLGHMRFQPPKPVEPWEGVRDATGMTPNCLQYDLSFKTFRGQEDCLFLNIFSPQDPTKPFKKHIPVMIFIHGGIFMFGGSGEFYGGRYFMDHDVILVTLNYRLGALGFLNTGDDLVTGNMGLKDQLEAFKFIKNTIQDFGGDPNSITIFGESAGGVSVHLHMLSQSSKGYFNRAISQSGSAFCPWAFTRNPREQAIRLGNQVGCPTNSSQSLIDCLTSLDAWDLIRPHEKVTDVFIDPQDIFGPSVENFTSAELKAKAFLSDYPYKLAVNGKTHKVPWISGVNSHEGCFRSALLMGYAAFPWLVGHTPHLNRLNEDWDAVASNAFFLFQNDSKSLSQLRDYHFGESRKEITIADYEALTNLVGDRLFTMPARDAALLHAKLSGAPTYLYFYTAKMDLTLGDYIATLSNESLMPRFLQLFLQIVQKQIYKRLDIPIMNYGSCHADEIFQLMSPVPTSIVDIKPGEDFYEFSKNMVKLWTTFAARGDPGDFNGVVWEKVNMSATGSKNSSTPATTPPQYLLLDGQNAKMIEEPFHSRVAFWQQLQLPRNLDPVQEFRYEHDVIKLSASSK